MENDEELHRVSSEAQREAFLKQLTETEDWLYEDGDAASVREYRDRLRELRQVGDPIFTRLAELHARPQVGLPGGREAGRWGGRLGASAWVGGAWRGCGGQA